MRALRLSLVLFVVFVTAFGLAEAQEAEPLRIGGTLPGEIAWSPDGAHLLVAASDVTRLYRTGEWDAPLRTFPAALRATWVNMRVVELDGQRYEVRTGRSVETPEDVPQNPARLVYNRLDYPSKRYTFESYEQYMESRLVLKITDTLKPDTGAFELLINDTGLVHRVLFSPDERYVAILYDDGRMRLQLWDLESRQRLFEKAAYRASTYLEIRFSIDSRTLVAVETSAFGYGPYGGSNEEHITVWDTTTGQRTFSDYGYWSTPVYSSNAEWFAYITGNTSAPAELVIWNGVELLHTGVEYPSNIRFDAVGDTLYAAVDSVGIAVIQLDIARRAIAEVSMIPLRSQYYAFSEDGRFVLGRGFPPPPALWNIETMSEVGVLDTEQSLNDVLFSPDSKFIAIDHKTFWDTETAEKVFETETPVSLAPDWSWAAYWDDGELVMHDLTGMTTVRQTLASSVLGRAVAVDPLERWALFRQDDTLAGYSLTSGEKLWVVPDVALTGSVVFTADGTHMAVPDNPDQNLWMLYETSGQSAPQQRQIVSSILSPDGRMYATFFVGYQDSGMIRWQSSVTDEVTGEWFTQDKYVFGIQYHPFKPLMAVEVVAYKTEHRALHLIDVDQTIARGGEPVSLLVIEDPYSTVTVLGFSPSGRYLSTSCGGTCIRLTDLLDLPEVGSLIEPKSSHFYDTSAISYDASESLLLMKTASKGEAQLLIPDTNESYIIPAVGKAIALNADGTLAATVIDDGIALWDVDAVRAGDVTLLTVYPITGLAPTQLTFDADDRLIALEPSGVTVYESLEVSR